MPDMELVLLYMAQHGTADCQKSLKDNLQQCFGK